MTADKNNLMDQIENDAPVCGMPDSLPKTARRLAGPNIKKTGNSTITMAILSGMGGCVDYAFIDKRVDVCARRAS